MGSVVYRDCGRQFVEHPQAQPNGLDTLSKIKLLLLERISLAGIAHVMGVSESWLQNYVNQRRCRNQSLGYAKSRGKIYSPNG